MKSAYRITIGIVILTVVAAVLLSTPSSIIAPTIALVDTEYQRSSGQETTVRTRFDFIRGEKLNEFPEDIGDWTKPQTFNWSGVEESLGADTILARAYRHPHSSDTFFFVIIQSKDVSSFHPPVICYPALGYEVAEVGLTEFTVANTAWAEKSKKPEAQKGSKVMTLGMVQTAEETEGRFKDKISAKKLVVTRGFGTESPQRRVVFYYYVRDEKASVPKTVTMIQISAATSLVGSYEPTLELAKQLAGDTFPLMFELRPREKMLGEWLITERGFWGALLVVSAVAAPIIFMFYPQIRRLRRLKVGDGDIPRG